MARSRIPDPRPAAPRSWRILRDPPASGARNMAMDVALARSCVDGEGVLRIYRWSRPTLSLGRNQPAVARYDPGAAESLGADVVRRPTGGREVLHDRELTYALVSPLGSLGGLRATYRVAGEALLAALRSLGIPAVAASGTGRAPDPSSGPCFDRPAEGEIEVDGRKLVGSAQARIGDAVLQHGSILLGPPTVSLDALRTDGWGGARGDPSGAVTLAEILPRPPGFSDVAAAVEAAFAGTMGGAWRRDVPSERERMAAEGLVAHYESNSWTWRR